MVGLPLNCGLCSWWAVIVVCVFPVVEAVVITRLVLIVLSLCLSSADWVGGVYTNEV